MQVGTRWVAAATLLAGLAAPARAGAAPLNLQESVRYALSHSPTIAQQVATVSQTQEAYVKARSAELPPVTGSLQNQMQKSANFIGTFGAVGLSQSSVFTQNTAQLGTQYTYNGGLSHFQTLAARQQYDQARSDLSKTQQQVTMSVANAYYTLATNAEGVRLDQGDLKYQGALVAVAKAKEHSGMAAGVDVLSASAQQEKSRYTLEAAVASEENARESLAQTIGAPLDTQFSVTVQVAQPAMPAPSIDTLIGMALANRPEIASAQQGVAVAQTNRRSADTDLYPQIQAFAGIGNQFSASLLASDYQSIAQQNAFNEANGLPLLPFPPRGNPGYWNIGVTSSISIPFWDWGARRANHRNLDEQIVAANQNLQAVQTQVEIDVRQAYRAAQTAQAQLSSAQDETSYATEAARIARLQYENGLKTLLDVQQAQQSALSAQADLFNARVAYVNAIVKLRSALGIYSPEQDVADLG